MNEKEVLEKFWKEVDYYSLGQYYRDSFTHARKFLEPALIRILIEYNKNTEVLEMVDKIFPNRAPHHIVIMSNKEYSKFRTKEERKYLDLIDNIKNQVNKTAMRLSKDE